MPASALDKISEAANGGIPAAARVTSTRAPGVTSLNVDTQTNWPTATGIKFSTYKVDTTNTKVAGSQTDWRGVSDGVNTINNIIAVGGAADAGNALDDVVVMGPTAQWGEDFAEAFLQEHINPNGQHGNIHSGTVDASGLITAHGGLVVPSGQVANILPALLNPHKFSVYLAASIANYLALGGTEYIVPYDTGLFDTGTDFNLTTHLFVAPIDGFYCFSAAVQIAAYANSAIALRLYQNSTQRLYDQRDAGSSGSNIHCSVSGLLQLSAGDTIKVTAVSSFNNTGVNGGQGITYFQAFLVSRT